MDVAKLKQGVQNQTVSLDSLLEIVLRLDARVRHLEAENRQLKSENKLLRERLGKYEPEVLKPSAESAHDPTDAGAPHYSVESEERRRNLKRRVPPARQGRVATAEFLRVPPDRVPPA